VPYYSSVQRLYVFVGVASMLLFMMSHLPVGMIKQLPEGAYCGSLSFHGDDIYIGSIDCVIQWNLVTDTALELEGYTGLILIDILCSL
jgi:hypothetical protein